MTEQWDHHVRSLGAFIREQRQLANLSLRRLAELAEISNPYLSQLERGLHEPSVHVLNSIARALNLSADTLLTQAGILAGEAPGAKPTEGTEAAIRRDPRLQAPQKLALLSVYRSYVDANDTGPAAPPPAPDPQSVSDLQSALGAQSSTGRRRAQPPAEPGPDTAP